jgi:RimJ/RimL family protein N-acetyltransferase
LAISLFSFPVTLKRRKTGLTFPSIETPRLLLRQFVEDDFDSYAEMCADAEVMRYIGEGRVLTRAEAWRNMAMIMGHWQLRGYGNWAVEERETGKLVGRIGFWNPEGWPGFELGWLLGHDHWGKGFAHEGAAAALEYGFNKLDRDHVISVIRPGNVRSIRVAERLGEKYERTVEILGGDAFIYGINRSDFFECGNHFKTTQCT